MHGAGQGGQVPLSLSLSLSRELKLEQFEATAQQKYKMVGQISVHNVSSIILF